VNCKLRFFLVASSFQHTRHGEQSRTVSVDEQASTRLSLNGSFYLNKEATICLTKYFSFCTLGIVDCSFLYGDPHEFRRPWPLVETNGAFPKCVAFRLHAATDSPTSGPPEIHSRGEAALSDHLLGRGRSQKKETAFSPPTGKPHFFAIASGPPSPSCDDHVAGGWALRFLPTDSQKVNSALPGFLFTGMLFSSNFEQLTRSGSPADARFCSLGRNGGWE